MFVTVIALKYALLASQSSYGHFLKQLIQFYLNNSINLRHSTERIKSCYTHKMAIVSWPTTMWRHFILCTLIAKLRSYLHPDRNHNPHQNCLKLYFSTLQETCQIQKRQSNSKNRIYYLETSVWLYFRQLANARTAKNIEKLLRQLPRLPQWISTLCLRKKQDTELSPITSPNVNRFSKFFH